MLAHSPAAVPCSSLWFSEQKRNYSQSIARGRVAEGSLRKAFYPNTAPMLRKYNDLEKPFPVEISTQKKSIFDNVRGFCPFSSSASLLHRCHYGFVTESFHSRAEERLCDK